MGEAVKDGVESEEEASCEAKSHRNEEEATGQEGDISNTQTGQQRGKYSSGFPDMGLISHIKAKLFLFYTLLIL